MNSKLFLAAFLGLLAGNIGSPTYACSQAAKKTSAAEWRTTLFRQSDAIIAGRAIFNLDTGAGILHPIIIRKGEREKVYKIKFEKPEDGDGSLCAGPWRPKSKRMTGTFYLNEWGGHLTVTVFTREI